MTIQEPAVDLSQPRPDEKRRFPVFTKRHTTTATVLALLAWTVAVFDYGLFGTLLPAMQQEFGWSATRRTPSTRGSRSAPLSSASASVPSSTGSAAAKA
ncbi:hypothetical protein [Arthrobacter sp. 162MFSha1.1]|uniref:hypothetical protein n=1 Tax=Arthrobacter sp. 162MFSha1.1 TaxID=1151119 RepID=UPI00039D9351|nr:hypothetical protein [Arthrobacter sp. 162MFSha1.1]